MRATVLNMTTDAVQAKVAKSIRACRFLPHICVCPSMFFRFLNLGLHFYLYLHIHELHWISVDYIDPPAISLFCQVIHLPASPCCIHFCVTCKRGLTKRSLG